MISLHEVDRISPLKVRDIQLELKSASDGNIFQKYQGMTDECKLSRESADLLVEKINERHEKADRIKRAYYGRII